MKSEFQKPIPQSDSTAAPTATPETPGQREPLASAEDRARLPGKEASGSAPQGTAGLPQGHCGAMSDACPVETEDRPPPPRCGAPAGGDSDSGCPERDGAAADLEQSHTPPLQMDNSVLLDDDSNQPMPVSRFFGNVELMQVRPVASPLGRQPPADRTPGHSPSSHVECHPVQITHSKSSNPGGESRTAAGVGHPPHGAENRCHSERGCGRAGGRESGPCCGV